MPVPATIADLTNTPATNSPQGTESAKGTIDDYLRSHGAFIRQLSDLTQGPTTVLASAATVAIGFPNTNNISITGTTTISAFDTYAEGALRYIVFAGALTLTYNGTSMQLPGAASILTVAGDSALFKSLGGGNWKCIAYTRIGVAFPASGTLLSTAAAVTIAQGGTGTTTAAAAIAALGGLPLAGGILTGAMVLSNGTPIQVKDSGGTARNFAYIDASNNVNLFNAGGGVTRIWNQAFSTALWSADNSGNTTQSGNLTFANNNSAIYAKDVGGTTRLLLQVASDNNTYFSNVGGQNVYFTNQAGTAVATLTNAGAFSAVTVGQSSDERKKKKWQRMPGDFLARLAGIRKSGLFTWKKGGARGVGIGAQSLEAILPEAVHTDDKGDKTVNYGAAAMVSAVELAREMVRMRARLEKLEAR